MKNNIYTAIPDWFNKLQSQSTDNTSTTTTQTTIIGGGGSISMSVHNLFIKSDTTITIDDFTISDLFVTDQITDTENWLTTPLLHTLPNTEVSVTTAAQQLYIGAYDKNNNQIKLYQFSEAISTVVIPENCYYLRASSNKTNTDLTIKYVGLNNFDETQQNKLESSFFQNFLTLVEGDEKGVITNSVQNLSLVFQNPLYYTLDKAGNVLISIDRDALFSQSENPTDDRYVTTVANSVQDILSSKNFKEGLSINGIEIVERNGFLYIKGNLATTGGITAYTDDPDDPGGSGGLPGGGAIGDIVITGSGNALVDASLSEDHSVITFTKSWLVDAESDQSITGIKNFINGLKLDGQLIKIVDGVLFLDCSIAATGGITAYATMPGEGSSSIMDQLVVDTEYFIITEEGVLTIVPGSVGGISNIYVTGDGNALTTVTLSEDGKTVSFTKDKNFADQAEMSAYKAEVNQTIAEFKNEVNEQLKHFVTLDTEQEITAIKHFIEGVTIGSNKHKFYERDGVLWLEGDIAITGGITTYATENVDVSTIMDGVAVDEITITKGSDNILRVKDAGAGSSFDENAMWSALASFSDKQINKSHLTTALTGYATESWVSGKNYAVKATTLAGYGITDGINAVSVTGTGNAVTAASISGHTLTLTKGSTFSLSGHKHAWADITSGKPSTLSGYGITDAYTKTESDNKYPTKTGSGASGTWGINVTGNAGSATMLQTARTLWGRSFDGTGNVSGNLDNVGNITGSGTINVITKNNQNIRFKINNDDTLSIVLELKSFRPFGAASNCINLGSSDAKWRDLYLGGNAYVDGITKTEEIYIGDIRLHKTADGVITLEGNLAVTGGITTYAIDPVSASTIMDGVVVDGTTIKKENGKLVAVGGGEAGSVAWGNISGKPSVFATNIANITDLHSSWDAVLKAQKPNWLTAVSIATISDLHANWDALLKAAPSAYVTRWPSFAEVTGKPTTLSGYGITDAYTKTDSDNRYINASGDTMTGDLYFNNSSYPFFNKSNSYAFYNISVNLESWPNNYFYPVRVTSNTAVFPLCTVSISSTSGSASLLLNNNSIRFMVRSGGWSDIGKRLIVLDHWAYSSSEITIYAIYLGEEDGDCVVYLRGGVNYTISISGRDWISSSDSMLTNGNEKYPKIDLSGNPTDGRSFARCYRAWTHADGYGVGLNAEYADNSKSTEIVNIASETGSLTGTTLPSNLGLQVFSYYQSGNGPTSYGNFLRIRGNSGGCGELFLGWNPDNTTSNIWYKSKRDTGSWGSWRTVAFTDMNVESATRLQTARNIWGVSFDGTKDVTGNITLGNYDIIGYNGARIIQNLSGNLGINPSENVGIGTTSPQYKLHVSGTIFSNSEVKCVRYVYDDVTQTGLGVASYFLDNQPVIRHANEIASVPKGSCRPIIRWGDAMSGIGYNTRYLIASIRDDSYDWGRIFMAVSNNDAGTSVGCTFSIYGSGYVEVTGNILSTGGITAYSSDIRAKNIIENIELSLKQISEAPTVRFKWNGWKLEDDGKTHIGGLAQYTQKVLPEAVLNTNDFLNMDYATTGYIFAVHTARHLLDYETKTDKEIRKLKNRIKYLEKQLKSLHYEEANIVDN